MGAAALVALVVGGLPGACLFLAYGVVHALKIAKVDAGYAAKGELPPSARLVDKWLDGRKARGLAPPSAVVKPYGSRAYAKQRWAAMWEDLGDRHREVREQYKQACAKAKAEGRQPPPKPTMRETITGWKWHLDQLAPATATSAATPPGATSSAPDVPQPPASPHTSTPAQRAPAPAMVPGVPGRNTAQTPPTESPATPDDTPPAGEQTREGATPHAGSDSPGPNDPMWDDLAADTVAAHRAARNLAGPNADAPYGWECFRCNARRTGFGVRAAAQHGYDTHTCLPKQPAPSGADTTDQGDSMTQTTQSGEVTGIRSAVQYMIAVAETHTQHGGNEQILTAMHNMRIGAGDVDLVRQAQEKSRNAAELWTTAKTEIEKHNAGVREGFASAPDAADKHAQVAE